MQILDVEADGFLGLPNGTYRFSDPQGGEPFPVSLVTGPSGSGKTALLEAIIVLKESVASRFARPTLWRYLRSGARTGRLAGRFLLSPEEQDYAELSDGTYSVAILLHDKLPAPPKPLVEQVFRGGVGGSGRGNFEYFPCNRQLVARLGHAPSDEGAAYRLTRRADKYSGVEQMLGRVAAKEGLATIARIEGEGVVVKGDHPDAFGKYRAAIAALCPRLHLLRVDVGSEGPVVWFKRAGGAVVDLYRLSQGEQQAVLFATTFLHYELSSSLVLVDGPELHIHPSERARFFAGLEKLVNRTQIIATTDAQEILGATNPRHVIALDH